MSMYYPSQCNFYASDNYAPPLSLGIHMGPGLVLNCHDMKVLFDAIESLYNDRILPLETTVKARLKVHGASAQLLTIFTGLYHSLPSYTVEKMKRYSDQHAIFFKNGFEGFKGWVDATSDHDCYPKTLWDDFEKYLGELGELRAQHRHCPVTFHRGRYGMSIELQKQNLPFFKDRALGEICHIVELAIQKKLLLYENNMLLPAMACESLSNAMFGRPTASMACETRSDDYIRTMDELRDILHFLLGNYPDGFNLSTLKTKIRGVFNKRLSETVFHQTKLLDLVSMPPLDTVVSVVKLEGNCGYLCKPRHPKRSSSKTSTAASKRTSWVSN